MVEIDPNSILKLKSMMLEIGSDCRIITERTADLHGRIYALNRVLEAALDGEDISQMPEITEQPIKKKRGKRKIKPLI